MKWINNLNIKNKLLLGFALLLAFVLIMIYTAFNSLTTMRESQRILTNIEYPLSIELLTLRTSINRERITINRIVMIQDAQKTKELQDEMDDLDTTVTSILDSIKVLAKDYAQIIADIESFSTARKTFRMYVDTLLNVYNTPQTRVKAEALVLGAMFDLNENMREIVVALSKISEGNDALAKQNAKTAFNDVVVSFSFFCVLLILICIGLTIFFVRSIAKPIQALAQNAEQIAYGDLSVKINVKDGKDEVAVMQRSFGMMVSSLNSVAEELKSTVGTLDNISSEINNELNTGFNDTAAILRWIEKFSGNISAISQRLNALMNEFKL
ncbi:MAG: HAMP domain-containing protein [Ignavibacteriaceae bacterium]|nr:HAMP domain-containing protein [Ignavibacteriaceae bacterium]